MSATKRPLSWWQKPLFAFAASRLGGWYFLTIAPRIDPLLLRASRGRVSSGLGQPVGILKIRGARSGLIRETTLLCTPVDEGYLVVASRAGSEKHPAWYYNLRANPDIQLEIGGEEQAYVAHELHGADREAYWAKAVWFYPGYAAYQKRASVRTIPIFLLTPTNE